MMTYGNFHPLSADEFHTTHGVLLHLHQLGKLLGQVWAEGAGRGLAERMACTTSKTEKMLAPLSFLVAARATTK